MATRRDPPFEHPPQPGNVALQVHHGRAWRDGRLTLRLRWRFEELPVLLDLPDEVRLSWHGGDDPEAGIRVRLGRWRFEADQVRLWLGLE